MPTDQHFAVPTPPKRAAITLAGLLAATALVGPALMLFETNRSAGFWIGVIAVSLLPLVILAVLLAAMRRRSIDIVEGVLEIRASFYTRRTPLEMLDQASARSVHVAEHPELRPLIKTNGFALPGYYAGHFRSRSWKKIFALVTSDRAVAVEEKAGTLLLLSVERPQALVDALSRSTEPPARGRRASAKDHA